MALDFIIGNSHQSVSPVWSLSEEMHTQLFVRTEELRRLPLLGRIVDFYSDISFEEAELPTLSAELEQIIPLFAGRPQMQEALRQFHKICREAITQGKGLHGICD